MFWFLIVLYVSKILPYVRQLGTIRSLCEKNRLQWNHLLLYPLLPFNPFSCVDLCNWLGYKRVGFQSCVLDLDTLSSSGSQSTKYIGSKRITNYFFIYVYTHVYTQHLWFNLNIKITEISISVCLLYTSILVHYVFYIYLFRF